MNLNKWLLMAIMGLPVISMAESDDARITKLENEIKKLQESNAEILNKLNEQQTPMVIRRRAQPSVAQGAAITETEPNEITENFNGHKYQFISDKKSWNLASKMAKQKGGYLVSITSADENSFVTKLIQKACENRKDKNPKVWIGLNKDNLKGDWLWESGEKYDFSAWGEGEPNNQGNTESSVLLNHESFNPNKIGKWNDGNSEDKIYFIVEYDKD